MGQIGTAFRAFFAALFSGSQAERIRQALAAETLPKVTQGEKRQPAERPSPPPATPPKRSEAVTLLSALQREARLVDLVQEPLENYTDEQIGAAARGVLRDTAGVLKRFFALQSVVAQDEGAEADVPAGYDATRYRLTGRVEGGGPFRGKVVHRGWQATNLALPAWTGSKDAALVIAPAEVEI